ncbi:hypothetical protein ACFQY4_06215 [Catellatospora bangladeshensis]|uniref:hypothetical protein n=1 Tax=Catellatospora bangladeshensis TaxID=310355 RepID=UPI003606CBE5
MRLVKLLLLAGGQLVQGAQAGQQLAVGRLVQQGVPAPEGARPVRGRGDAGDVLLCGVGPDLQRPEVAFELGDLGAGLLELAVQLVVLLDDLLQLCRLRGDLLAELGGAGLGVGGRGGDQQPDDQCTGGASRRAAARQPLPWGMTRYGWPFSVAAYRVS